MITTIYILLSLLIVLNLPDYVSDYPEPTRLCFWLTWTYQIMFLIIVNLPDYVSDYPESTRLCFWLSWTYQIMFLKLNSWLSWTYQIMFLKFNSWLSWTYRIMFLKLNSQLCTRFNFPFYGFQTHDFQPHKNFTFNFINSYAPLSEKLSLCHKLWCSNPYNCNPVS